MCGRYSIIIPLIDILDELKADLPDFDLPPRYNAAPTQMLPVITSEQPEKIRLFRWGLIPFWAKDPSIGSKMINARAETLPEKTSFRNLLKNNRCLVLADGFYEWKKEKSGKQPLRIQMKDNSLITFAGLWDKWKDAEGKEIFSFTIITVPPNTFMKSIHDRMPAILPPSFRKLWLDPSLEVRKAMDLLNPFPGVDLKAKLVSTKVNSPAFDGPEILE